MFSNLITREEASGVGGKQKVRVNVDDGQARNEIKWNCVYFMGNRFYEWHRRRSVAAGPRRITQKAYK